MEKILFKTLILSEQAFFLSTNYALCFGIKQEVLNFDLVY